MGFALQPLGEAGKALGYYEQQVEMFKKLYPAERFKDGHPDLAQSLGNMGLVLLALGEAGKARGYFEQQVEMTGKLTSRTIGMASEAQAMGFLASLPRDRDAYLSATILADQKVAASLDLVWERQAAVLRLLRREEQFVNGDEAFGGQRSALLPDVTLRIRGVPLEVGLLAGCEVHTLRRPIIAD